MSKYIADQIWVSPGVAFGSLLNLLVSRIPAKKPAGRKERMWECLKRVKFELQTTNIYNRILIRRITLSQPQGRAATRTAQMSPITFGFRIIIDKFLPGNPQADVFLANNFEQRLLPENSLVALITRVDCLLGILLQKEQWNLNSGADPYLWGSS